MLSFLKNIFDDQGREIKRLSKLVNEANSWEAKIGKLSDQELALKTKEFKKRLAKETLDSFLPEAFAVVRASRRTIGLRHFDVQLLLLALFEGKIAGQNRRGKTLSATPALYLRALEGRGAR